MTMCIRNCMLFVFRVCWLLILVRAYFQQNQSCLVVPKEINKCLLFGGRYIFMTHWLQLSLKLTYTALILSTIFPSFISEKRFISIWSNFLVPLSTCVSSLYYILYSINPHLVRNPLAVPVSTVRPYSILSII